MHPFAAVHDMPVAGQQAAGLTRIWAKPAFTVISLQRLVGGIVVALAVSGGLREGFATAHEAAAIQVQGLPVYHPGISALVSARATPQHLHTRRN